MPSPLDPAKRATIVDALQGPGDPNVSQIARDEGVAKSTVHKIAREEGVNLERTRTKNATAAAQADNRARRAGLSQRFLEKANEALDQMEGPFLAFNFGGKDNTYNQHELERPPTGDLRNLMVVAATAFDKHLAAELHDTGDPDTSEVAQLRDTMREVSDQLKAQIRGGQ
jgi:transposase-like protein